MTEDKKTILSNIERLENLINTKDCRPIDVTNLARYRRQLRDINMLPVHLDPAIPLEVPDAVRQRIVKANYSQRSRARKINKRLAKLNAKLPKEQKKTLITIRKFDIIDLFSSQNWTCQCYRVPNHKGCYRRVDITKSGRDDNAPCIGHINNLENGGSHIPENIGVMRNICNTEIANAIEKTRAAKVERLSKANTGRDRYGKKVKPKVKKRFPSRQIPNRNNPWPKGRKMQSKNKW